MQYTEEEIQWAIGKLKEKHPEKATREQAVKLLDTFKGVAGTVVNKIKEDKKSGKLKSEPKN